MTDQQNNTPYIAPIDGETQLVGIIGWPVAHSFSPIMHNAAFAALNLNWRYVPLPVQDANLLAALKGLPSLGFRGVNVTVPHKTAIMPYLNSIDDHARTIGAVNTITIDGESGALHGLNTDVIGFMADLRAHHLQVNNTSRVIVLGAGGAARACTAGLVQAGATVVLVNRTIARAESILRDFDTFTTDGKLRAIAWAQLPEIVDQGVTLIVNATSVGMWPEVDSSPWPMTIPFPPAAVLYDSIYRPQQTKLMCDASQSGLTVFGGLGMLIEQGAAAFSIWTGQPAPIDVMKNVWLTRL